jgi:molybdenum cofactor synthesis domain-containing protein
MCGIHSDNKRNGAGLKTIPVTEAIGMVLVHDITEIRKDEFKGRAFKKGHIVKAEDICKLQRLGKEHLYVLDIPEDEMHEDDAAYAIANALMGEGVEIEDGPREGKINIIAARDGLVKIDRSALLEFNMLGDVMCATLHGNTIVKKGRVVAGTRAVPLTVKKSIIEKAVATAKKSAGVIGVTEIRKPRAGIVITGNEVYYGRIKDAFAPIIAKKVEEFGGEIAGVYYAPDDESFIEARLRELLEAGADVLITTGGMSVDPDDVTRFAINRLGARDMTYGSSVLPGAMFMVAYVSAEVGNKRGSSEVKDVFRASALIPILGIPACGLFHKTTIFDLIFPRVLAGEKIGRAELAELGHGGLCLNCKECTYPICPFGK